MSVIVLKRLSLVLLYPLVFVLEYLFQIIVAIISIWFLLTVLGGGRDRWDDRAYDRYENHRN